MCLKILPALEMMRPLVVNVYEHMCTHTHTHHTRDDGGSDATVPEVIEYYPCCASPLF